ncbi:23L protein [Yaba-like disease virus]|uniref:23L protein n=1 Tax=Yaba-like disease virus TaxID=132475 RepID=Q9DHT9_YLDV|nr:23L protein [Yaba-like disease virus]CAC21261.1 23L protein [Yaba-like disease virus]
MGNCSRKQNKNIKTSDDYDYYLDNFLDNEYFKFSCTNVNNNKLKNKNHTRRNNNNTIDSRKSYCSIKSVYF